MIGLIAVAAGIFQSSAETYPLWSPAGMADEADSFVAFRGSLTSTGALPYTLQVTGASEFLVWLDGALIYDGPARYAKAFPEYQSIPLPMPKGTHTIAVQARNNGVTTRILSEIRPFIWCRLLSAQDTVDVTWKCNRIPGYKPQVRRISNILGWIDWCDTRQMWSNWQQAGFDDAGWREPVRVDPMLGSFAPAKTRPVRLNSISLKTMASGKMATTYGYEEDDPAARFFLNDLKPEAFPAQGVWRRYDLGRVRLGRPKFILDLTKGSIVEFAQSEQLVSGRVTPWITLSGSASCNIDHFVARGGKQEFMPFTAKGGRYLEVHVKSSGTVRFVRESYLERTHFDDPVGSFECEDVLLNKIWMTGVNTVRSCSEDAFVDCPTRERGQWTGDVASVATDIAAVAWSDLSLARRALVQAAQAAREDGLVAGVGPGDPGYLSTYAAQWVSACLHYWELTGDKTLLTELLPAAQKNLAAFRAHLTEEGLNDSLGWGFIDWGYVRNQGPSDMALNIHYLMALRAMTRWERSVGDTKRSEDYNALAHQVESVLTKWLDKRLKLPGGWNNVGYHVAALSLLADVVPKSKIPECKTRIKSHLLECFPNKAAAPRLSDPSVADEKIMTPYFCHFSFAALLQHGEAVFVLDQYRKCWGWALGDNRTTWLEVFDTRWSHCHEWSGCPTWQLSRHILGLQPRFDLGPNTFMLQVRTGGLSSAKGIVPTPSNNQVSVSWKRLRTEIIVTLRAAAPINVLVGKNLYESKRFMKVSLPLN